MSAEGAGHLHRRSEVMRRFLRVPRSIAQLLPLSVEFILSNETRLWPAAGDFFERMQQIVVNAVNET